MIDRSGDSLNEADDQAAFTRSEGVSRRVAIGSVTGLAIMSSSSSRSRTAHSNPVEGGGRRADPRDTVSPEQHGAVGDGVVDDTAALQAAFGTGRSVSLTSGRTYLITSALRLSTDNVTVAGGGWIKISRAFDLSSDRDSNGTHMRALFIAGANTAIIGVGFDATDAPAGSAVENGLIWSRAPFTTVHDCHFLGNLKGTCIWGLSDAPYMSVQDCRFQDCSGAVFAKGRNTIISGNIIINATDAAIAINGQSCIGAVVANNTISNDNLVPIPSMIAVEDAASSWVISGNTLLGVNGGGILCTNILDYKRVKAGVISDNVIDAQVVGDQQPYNKNPSTMISVSEKYTEWIIHANKITSCSKGNSNSRLAMLAASGGIFCNNIIDARNAAGLSAIVEISAGQDGVIIKDNKTLATVGARHYLIGKGEFGLPCEFYGGWLLEGQEGINAELNSANITNLILEVKDVKSNTSKTLINAFTILGDRCAFLNAGAWTRSHHVGRYTEMYATQDPKNAGTTPFQTGDRFHFLDPRINGGMGVIRTSNGWMRF